MEAWLKKHPKGSILHLYIGPGASKNEFAGLHGDRLKVRIKAPPQDGEANAALLTFIGKFFGISKSKVHLLKGESSRQKDILLELSPEEIILLKPELL